MDDKLTAHPLEALRALGAIEALSPEYGPGFTDHAPMCIEALERLDPSALGPFLAAYTPRLRPLAKEPDPSLADFPERAARELAAIERVGTFEALRVALEEHLSRHVAGAAFHGILRVAHAARALGRADAPEWRRELARGLAYARLRGEALPQRPSEPAPSDGIDVAEALRALSPPADALAYDPGMITPILAGRAAAHPELAAVSARVRSAEDPRERAHTLREEAARLLALGEHHPGNTFTLLHGVTGMDAVCALVALVPEATGRMLVREATHALLCMRVAFVGALDGGVAATSAEPFDALRARAVESLQDHSLKLAAALLEAERARPSELHAKALARWLAG